MSHDDGAISSIRRLPYLEVRSATLRCHTWSMGITFILFIVVVLVVVVAIGAGAVAFFNDRKDR